MPAVLAQTSPPRWANRGEKSLLEGKAAWGYAAREDGILCHRAWSMMNLKHNPHRARRCSRDGGDY